MKKTVLILSFTLLAALTFTAYASVNSNTATVEQSKEEPKEAPKEATKAEATEKSCDKKKAECSKEKKAECTKKESKECAKACSDKK